MSLSKPHFTITNVSKTSAAKMMLSSLKPDEIVFLNKVDDLEELIKAGAFHLYGQPTSTGSFAKSLILQFRTKGNLSPTQKTWVRILLDRALLGPETFPPAKVGGKLLPSCKACGSALTLQTLAPSKAKGLCKTCVRKYSHD